MIDLKVCKRHVKDLWRGTIYEVSSTFQCEICMLINTFLRKRDRITEALYNLAVTNINLGFKLTEWFVGTFKSRVNIWSPFSVSMDDLGKLTQMIIDLNGSGVGLSGIAQSLVKQKSQVSSTVGKVIDDIIDKIGPDMLIISQARKKVIDARRNLERASQIPPNRSQ